MTDGVWGNVKDWGLQEHGDGSADFSIDLVCGTRVNESKAAGKTGYAGAMYYFCSKECQRNFEQAPGNYIGQPHWPSRTEVDINTAAAKELKRIFHVGDDVVDRIVRQRPYRGWTDFQRKNPGFSNPLLESLKQNCVSISPPGIGRMV